MPNSPWKPVYHEQSSHRPRPHVECFYCVGREIGERATILLQHGPDDSDRAYRYGTREEAQRVADQLNEAGESAGTHS